MKTLIGRVLLVAFIIRLLVPIVAWINNPDHTIFHAIDSNSYIAPASHLISSGRFNDVFDKPDLFRTPGYPLLLTPGLLLGNLELVTIALQIGLSCLTVYLVYKIVLLLLGRVRIAALCAFLYALEPLSILYTSKLVTETLYTTLLTFFLYSFLKYLNNRTLRELIISSIALAASAYARPSSYYLPFLLALFVAIWIWIKGKDYKALLVHAGTFFIVSMGLISCWNIRNYVVAGYSGFSTVATVNLYFFNAAQVLGDKKGIPYEQEQHQMWSYDKNIKCHLNPIEYPCNRAEAYNSMKKDGLKIIAENRFLYATLHIKGILRVLLGPAGTDAVKLLFGHDLQTYAMQDNTVKESIRLFQKQPLFFIVYVSLGVILYVYLLLALIGLFYGLFKKNMPTTPLMILLSVAAYFLAISGGAVGQGRYRHPIMPIICILAGYGLSVILDRLKAGNRNTKMPVVSETTLP
jgi:hypothetical protein